MKEYDPKEPIKQIKNKPSEKNEKQQHQDVESENSKKQLVARLKIQKRKNKLLLI